MRSLGQGIKRRRPAAAWLAALIGLLLSGCGVSVSDGAITDAVSGEAIPHVSVLDAFDRQELPLATGKWSKTSWTEEIGSSWRGKWHGYGADLSHLAGAYWNRASFSDSDGPVVAAATLGTGPIYERWPNEYLSLWIDMPNPGRVRSGYEVRFRGAHHRSNAYVVELSIWASGQRTVLVRRRKVSLPVNTMFALSETGGSLAVWTGRRTLTPILSATDSTYTSGYLGIEANRGEGTAYNFRGGNVGGGTSREAEQATPRAAPASAVGGGEAALKS